MWKAAFTGRSEKGDKDRDTASVSGRSEARRKKSSRSTRGDVDDTASVMSGSSRRHRSSRHESSSRYGDEEDRDRTKDSSYYSGPPSVYGSAATYASPGSSAYATAPTSRVGAPESRPLTASALRMLPDDDNDEWEDDEKTVRSERRTSTKKRSPSDERDRRRKSSGKSGDKERERKRSSSRERKEKKRSSTSEKVKDKSRRSEPELVAESSRAIPAMGSFEQFPGQYGGGVMGQHTDYTMSGALPNVPQSQFPGQDYTAPYEQAAPPQVGITRADSYGHAAEYYLDEGQSVAHQPGNRASTPNMLANPDQHLMAASSVPNPAQDTGNGTAADFYNDATSYSAPVTPAKPSTKPGKQSSFSASKPSKTSSKPSKPSRTSSAGAVAAGLAGVAGVSALGKMGKTGRTSHQYSQSEQTTSASYQQGAPTHSDYPPSINSQQRPPRHASDGNVFYAQPAQNGAAMGTSHATSSAYGASYTGSSAHGPSYENTYGTGNIPSKNTNQSNAGLYAAGAAAAGAAAYGIHQHHQHGRTDSNMAIAGDFGGNGQGPPRSPRPTGNGGYYPSGSNGNAGGMMQQGHFHEHKGPMTKLKDGLLNLISTPEDVAKMEMYTEYIGVCKHCFDPRTSAWDAPRVHHYHKRRDSFESLRRRASRDKLRRQGSYERVDKESRYYASDSSRRRREERHSGVGLAGAGLAAVGTGLAANALFNNRKDFDDTYSVKSGHRESSAMRRRSRSSSRERRRRSQYGTTRPGQDEFANVTVRKKDGTVEYRRVVRSRSRSGDRNSGFGIGTAAAAGAALGAAGLAASARRRSRSSSRDRRRRSTRVSPGRSEYSRYEHDDRRKSEEGGRGIFGNFFSPPRKQRRNSREHQKKRGGFFTFSNGSSSSSNSELAFGGSFVSRNGSKTSLSRKSSGRSTRGRPQRKSSDQHLAATLAGIGATAAALSAAKAGHRISKRTSRPELGARRQVKQHVVGDHRHGSPGPSGEDGWEDELPSDDASSADGLAFGDYGGKRLSGRQSLESVASASSASGLGAWGWRWGGKDKKRRSRRSTSGELPYPNSEYGSSIGPIGAGIAAGAAGAAAGSIFDTSRPQSDRPVYLDDTGRPLPSVDARSSTSGASSQPLQYVDPKPVSEAGTPRYQTTSGTFETPSRAPSMPGAFEPDDAPIYRPGPGIVQHPQPMLPARPAFTQTGADQGYTATAGAYDNRPTPRRTQSSPVQSSWGQDAALIGAGVLGAGAIIAGSAMSSGRKARDSPSNVRFGLTEEQERKESRSTRRKDQEAEEERRRSDRTRALKEEAERAAKASRQEEVLRAREAENQARAQARLDLQREQERKEAEEARVRAEQRAREERERQWEIERLEKEAVDRRAAAAAATADFERQRQAREEAERRQAEVEKQNRERDEALRQQYQLAEEARRDDEERRQWEAERFAREYQEHGKTTATRDFTVPASARDRRESDDTRKEPSGWGTVAMGAAAAAGVGAVMAGRDEKKRRQSGKSDSTDDTPVSRRAPRTSIDWNVDAHAADREAASQAQVDRQAREQYGPASSGNVELKNGYAAAEIKPGSDEQGEPITDDDVFDPDFFKRSQHTPAERARREELARKAADKVVADRTRAYSPDSRPKESYADFFAEEVKDVLARKPGEKERSIQPDSDVQVYHVEQDGVQPAFTLRNDLGGKSKHAPYGVPQLNVIAPTPPPGSRTGSAKGSVPSSPLSKAADAGAGRDGSPESSKDSGKSDRSRSISWGEDKTHIYDVQTPESYLEKDRDSYITSPDIRGVGAGIAAAAGAAVAGAALHDIVVEDGEKKTVYKDDDFSTTSSSKKSKKDKKKAKKASKSHSDDADSNFLDNLSNKDKAAASFQEVPPERGTEAPYKENEFSRTRRDNDRDRQQEGIVDDQPRTQAPQYPETLPHPMYQQPFFDSVSDFSGFRAVDSPGTEGAPPVRGFVEGETEEPTPVEEKRPHIPGGFDDDEEIYRPQPAKIEPLNEADSKSESREEEPAWQPPLSKKDKKKRDKESKRAGSETLATSEPSTPAAEVEVVEEQGWDSSLSTKEMKKRDSEAKRASNSTFDAATVAPVAEPEEAAWQAPLSVKEKKKRDKEAKRASGSYDVEPATPVAEREADVDAWEPPLSAKERKKREKAAKKAGIDSAYSEEPTPVAESPKTVEEDADEYFPSSSSKKDKKKKAKQFDEGLQRIASTTSAVSMPSWSGDTVVSDVTAKPPSPELTKAEQREPAKGTKISPGFSFADVTDTILASGGMAAAATALHDSAEDSASGSTSKKDKKRKKKAKLGEPGYEYLPDEPSGMPGGWNSPERKSSLDETPLGSAREVAVDPFDVQSSNEASSTSVPAPPEPTPVKESDPWDESFESASNKKSKKKSKRSSVAFDNIPQVSSPLRSEIAWDDYIGANGTNGDRKADSEAARSDPITVIERKSSNEGKGSRKSSKDDEFYDAGQRTSHSPREISPEDARSIASSADADRESRRKSRRDEARRGSDYYDQPDYAYEVQSVTASEPADEEGRKKHKSRSKRDDDDAVSMSSSRRRSRNADDDDDTRSVTSRRSRRDKEGSPVVSKEKKGIFGSLFGRKSTEDASRESKKDEDDEDRHRRKKKHRDSEYGGDDDDTRSVKSESHRRRHRSSDEKHDDESRERRRRSTHDDDDKYSESGSRHHRRRKTDENGESLSRHQSRESRDDKSERPKHHRRRTDEDKHDTRDQSFLGSRVEELPPLPASRPDSPDQAVERMEGRPLEAGFGTGLVSVAAAGLAAGVVVSALSRDKQDKNKSKRKKERQSSRERATDQTARSEPLPSAAAHSFPLPYVLESSEARAIEEYEESAPQNPAPVLEKPSRPVSVGRPGSSTAVPLRLPGHAPATPGGKERTKSVSSPIAVAPAGSALSSPATPASAKSRQGRPHSSDLKSGIMPLYLVERSRPIQEVEDSLPSLPSSKPSSRASSVQGSDEYESAREEFSAVNSPERNRSRSLTLDTIGANERRGDDDILDSQQTTPKASEWPRTAIPWSVPASAEKRERQEPQFYTWEDFARDERMHEQQDEPSLTARGDDEGPEAYSRARSKSPSKAKALAAAAMLGTAAVYATHKVADRSPERAVEAARDAPFSSSAAHSYPLPYVPELVKETEAQGEPRVIESPRELEQAFEPTVSSKKSKKKGKKGRKLQASEEEAPAEPATAVQPELESSGAIVEDRPEADIASRDFAGQDTAWPSVAAHTSGVVPVINFTEPSPEKDEAGQDLHAKGGQDDSAGYFASSAAHSMPVYEMQEPAHDASHDERPTTAHRLPELKSEPAPLVVELRNVEVAPNATVEVEPAPKLTRKQSKKDKKKSKRTSIFEDDQPSHAESPAEQQEPASEALADVSRDVGETLTSQVNFGLSDFGAVAAGAASVWGLSQADAFRTSMEKVESGVDTDSPRQLGGAEETAQATDSKQVDAADNFEPLASKKRSKKEKKKASKASAWQDEAQSQDQAVETAQSEPTKEPVQSLEAEILDKSIEQSTESPDNQITVELDADNLSTPSSSSQKKSKKDKKKAASWAEPEIQAVAPVVTDEQRPTDLQAPEESLEPADPVDGSSAEMTSAAPDAGPSLPVLETTEATFSELPSKKSKKGKKKNKAMSWDALGEGPVAEPDASGVQTPATSDEALRTEVESQDVVADASSKEGPTTEVETPDVVTGADLQEEPATEQLGQDTAPSAVEAIALVSEDVAPTLNDSVPTVDTAANEELSVHATSGGGEQDRSIDGESPPPASKKQSKKDKKKKKKALSSDAFPEEVPISGEGKESEQPSEQSPAEGESAKEGDTSKADESTEAGVLDTELALTAGAVAAIAAAGLSQESEHIGAKETTVSDNIEKPEVDDIWAEPASKEKSKKDKKKKAALEWDEPTSSRDEQLLDASSAPVQDPQVDVPSAVELVEEEKPILSRKQSKKDKKKQKSLSWALSEEPKASDETSVEIAVVDAQAIDAAGVPASEITHEADREAVDEALHPTATPDDSFHDAEDFFDAPADADPWHDAAETPTKEKSSAEATVDTREKAGSGDQDSQQSPVKESSVDATDMSTQDPLLTSEASTQQSNLVDDVFGIASGTGELNTDDPGDREEIMADRGMEFEPERASEDMDAFGDPTPRDPAEWSLGTSKKSGKKGKKGRKSISKAPTKVDPVVPSSSETQKEPADSVEPVLDEQPKKIESEITEQNAAGRDAETVAVADIKDTTSDLETPPIQTVESPEVILDTERPDLALAVEAINDIEPVKVNDVQEDSPAILQSETEPSPASAAEDQSTPPKDDVDAYSWAPTSKKKKGKKGKKAQEASAANDSAERTVSDGTSASATTKNIVEEPCTAAVEAVASAGTDESQRDTLDEAVPAIDEQVVPAAAIDESESFTWAPISKKDKKKAKKAAKSGARTPQLLEEDVSQEEPAQISNEAAAQKIREVSDSKTTGDQTSLQLEKEELGVVKKDQPSTQEVGTAPQDDVVIDATTNEQSKDVGATEEVSTESVTTPSSNDQEAPVVEPESFEPSLSLRADEVFSDAAQLKESPEQQTNELPPPEDEFSWAPSSKKSKKKKKASKSVSESVSETPPVAKAAEDDSVEQTREQEPDSSRVAALAVGGAAAVVAGLLDKSHNDSTSPSEELEPASTFVDDSTSSSHNKHSEQGDGSSISPQAEELAPPANPEITTSSHDGSGMQDTTASPASAADAQDEWAASSSKKKKGKRNKKSAQVDWTSSATNDEVQDDRQETIDSSSIAAAKEVEHDTEDVPKADFQGTDTLSPEAEASQDGTSFEAPGDPLTSVEEKHPSYVATSATVEDQAGQNPVDDVLNLSGGHDVKNVQDDTKETPAAASVVPLAEPLIGEPDEWSATTSSKKKKGKKSKKLSAAEPVEQEPESSTPDPKTEINAESSVARSEQTTEKEPATDAVADDMWGTTSSKKKKGKKSKSAIDWAAEPSNVPLADPKSSTDQADTTNLTDDALIDTAPVTTAEPSAGNEDDFASFTTSKKKKAKKSNAAIDWAPEPSDEMPVDQGQSSDQIDTAIPSDDPPSVDVPVTAAAPPAADEDDFTNFPTSKKKKGKKGKKLDSCSEKLPSADAGLDSAEQLTSAEETQAPVETSPMLLVEAADNEQVTSASAESESKQGAAAITEESSRAPEIDPNRQQDVDTVGRRGDADAAGPGLIVDEASAELTPADELVNAATTESSTLERGAALGEDNVEAQAALDAVHAMASTQDADVAGPTEAQDKLDELANNVATTTESAQDEDQLWTPQTSKKSKKKSKKDKLNSVDLVEGVRNVESQADAILEESPATEAAEKPTEQPEDLSGDAAARSDPFTEEPPATEADDVLSSFSSKKKSKKAKKARQSLLDETSDSPAQTSQIDINRDLDVGTPAANVESAVSEHQVEEHTDEKEVLPSTKTTIAHPETVTQEVSMPDIAADDTPLPKSPSAETPAPDATTDDLFALQSGKKKKGKGKKARNSILEETSGTSGTAIDKTTDAATTELDDSAPQSTATTSQEQTEAESEDVWTPPSKGKKAKKNKKLQQVAAMNAQNEVDGQDSDSLRPEDSTSASEATPVAVEVPTDELSMLTKLEGQQDTHRTPEYETPLPITEDGTELETTRDAQNEVAIHDTQPADASQIPLPIEQPEASPAMDSMATAETVADVKCEDVLEQDVASIEPAFTASKSKKSKKESKKARKSAANSWEEPETESEQRSDRVDDSSANAGAIVGAATVVAAIAATATADDAKSENVDDWGSFSTKKSKKDKKKARKSGIEVPEVLQDTESAPATVEALETARTTDHTSLESEVPPVATSIEADTGSRVKSPGPQLSGDINIPSASIDQPVQGPETNPVKHEDRQEAQVLDTGRVPPVEPAHAAGDPDIDFTATVAAGLADSGFDPDMVINDPIFQRRASPAGVAEADPDEVSFAPSTSKKKRKGKKGQQAAEVVSSEIPTSATTEQRSTSNVDDIVNKTLEGTGFDPSLLAKAMAASREQSPVEAEDEFAFTTTKRKKNKKGKGKISNLDDGTATPVDTVSAGEPALPSAPAGDDTQRPADQETVTTDPALAPTAESREHAWLVQDEMDVDAMDKAYKAYKKNKRQQKKLKAANQSAGLSDTPDGSALEGAERSAIVSEAEDLSRRPVKDLQQSEQSRGGNDEASIKTRDEVGSPNSKSIVETVFPGLERIKLRTPASAGEKNNSTGDHRPTAETGSRGLMHTSEVSQHLPTDVPRTPAPRNEERGMSAAPHEATWSFAALHEDDRAPSTSPTRESSHRAVRDSGYETAKRSSQQTDRSSGEVPAIVRTSSSRDSLRQRRSLEPLRVSTPTSPDWNLQTPKQKTEHDTARTTSKHERMPSANTPLEPTKAASMSSPAFEQPSPSHTFSAKHDHPPSSNSKSSPATASEGHRERSALSPTSPRGPLDAIPEEQARHQHSRKRSKARAEVGGPEHIKAIRRTETPQAIRAQEQALSPSVRHGSSGDARSISNPLSTSDEVFNRLPWPAVDQDNDTVNLDRSLSRQPPQTSMTPDFRSGSVLSDRSNASANPFKSPQEMRSYSRNSNRSSTPSLRRTSLSGDLRAVSRRGGSDLSSLTGSAVGARASPQTIPFEPPPTPPLEHDELFNGSASRAVDMNDDVFQGFGDAQQSQVSPTRPPSVRKRQSMHINELESRLDYLVAENRALQEAQQASEGTRGIDGGSLQEALEARDLQLQAKDAEINQIKAMLQPLQEEVARLTELSNGLSEANKNLVDDTNGRYATLQAEHAEAHNQWQATARELEAVRGEHGRITSGMRDIVEAEIATALADKNAEILRLREQLDIAAEQIRAFQVQIQGSKASDWLVQRDEDYFDGSCQKLCQHVQQWVLRFSKMSDNRVCRLSTELNDDKIEARLDNAVLDGSDVDRLLGDRVRRRDVFMSVVMTMVWEYVFTRYLFGMDREQRQKLKALEKLLSDVGPPRAVAHWRATTLTLLSKRPSFDAQCALDTEAVAHEIFAVLCMLLPPPAASKEQLQVSLQKVLRVAVDLAIEMRTQRAEYIMLPPLQPEYDTNGDLVRKVYFNASLMNERSGLFSSNEELAAKHSVVKIVLFPLVVKKGDDVGEGDDEIVVCPAQVLVNNEEKRDKKIVRVMSGAMEIDGPIRSRQSNRSLMSEAPGSLGF